MIAAGLTSISAACCKTIGSTRTLSLRAASSFCALVRRGNCSKKRARQSCRSRVFCRASAIQSRCSSMNRSTTLFGTPQGTDTRTSPSLAMRMDSLRVRLYVTRMKSVVQQIGSFIPNTGCGIFYCVVNRFNSTMHAGLLKSFFQIIHRICLSLGKSQVVEAYCKDTLEQFANPDLSVAFVTHTHATPEMVAVAIEALRNRGFKTIYETFAGATITSHCGPMTLGILFINDGNQEE